MFLSCYDYGVDYTIALPVLILFTIYDGSVTIKTPMFEKLFHLAERSPEKSERELAIERNLEKMETEMHELLRTESMGGNARSVEISGKSWPCTAANGYADKQTGDIKTFGNYVDHVIVEQNGNFIFRLANQPFDEIDYSKGIPERDIRPIVEFIGKENFSTEAQDLLEDCIARWNTKYGLVEEAA